MGAANKTLGSGDVALITGGGGAIGLGIARACLDRGVRVALADINSGAIAANIDALGAANDALMGVLLDVRDGLAWQNAADEVEARFGPVTLLFNNAGVVSARAAANGRGLESLSLEEWQWTFAVNVDGVFLGLKTFIPRMKARAWPSHIVNTSSMMALLPVKASGLMPIAYPAAKAAIAQMTVQLRTELAQDGIDHIGLSILYPGAVKSTISASSLKLSPAGADNGPAATPMPQQQHNKNSGEGTTIRLGNGMDPLRVGPYVLNAIEQGRFHIVTHPEYRESYMEFSEEFRQSFKEGADPSFSDWTVDSIDLEWRPSTPIEG